MITTKVGFELIRIHPKFLERGLRITYDWFPSRQTILNLVNKWGNIPSKIQVLNLNSRIVLNKSFHFKFTTLVFKVNKLHFLSIRKPKQLKLLCRLVLANQNPRENDTLLITLLFVSNPCTWGVVKPGKQVFSAVARDFWF